MCVCVCHPTTSNALNGKLYSTMLCITLLIYRLKQPFLHLSVKWSGKCWESWEMLGGLPSRKKKNSGDFLGEKSWRNHLQCWHIGKLATRHDRTLKHSRCHSSQMFVTIVHPQKNRLADRFSAETARGWRILAKKCLNMLRSEARQSIDHDSGQ